jgi:DNA-binding NarL/FixJ family response regulator
VFAACGAQLLLRETIAALDVPSVASTPSALVTLTRRERQVAQLVGEGATNRQVARRLEMAEKTVEGHLSRIFGKLEVQSRAALAHLLATATVAR